MNFSASLSQTVTITINKIPNDDIFHGGMVSHQITGVQTQHGAKALVASQAYSSRVSTRHCRREQNSRRITALWFVRYGDIPLRGVSVEMSISDGGATS